MKKIIHPYCIEIDKIKGSRFIADIIPVQTIDEAIQEIARLKSHYKGASHICYAIRINRKLTRLSDDGEPKNSAGAPILQRLEALDIIDCLCTVTRYYGGVKLGIGGLIRAYGKAASMVLSECQMTEIEKKERVSLIYNYADTALIASILSMYPDVVEGNQYFEQVRTDVVIKSELKPLFIRSLMEKTSGRITILTDDD